LNNSYRSAFLRTPCIYIIMSIFKEFFSSNFWDRRHFGLNLKSRFPRMGKMGLFLWVIYKPRRNSGQSFSFLFYSIFFPQTILFSHTKFFKSKKGNLISWIGMISKFHGNLDFSRELIFVDFPKSAKFNSP